MPIYVCVYACVRARAHACVCAGLKVGGIASLNANNFWGNYESLAK